MRVGQRVAACMVADGRVDLGHFGPGGEADAVLDRWEEAITHLLHNLFIAGREYPLDRTFAGLVEKIGEAHALLSLRLRHAVDARLADPEWRAAYLSGAAPSPPSRRTWKTAPPPPRSAAHLLVHRILCYELFRAQLDLLDDSLKRKFRPPRMSLEPLTASAVARSHPGPRWESTSRRWRASTMPRSSRQIRC